MNGAEALVKTLEAGGIEACFANPGTSEMHLVGALDKSKTIRSVLVLFEGVATGAADGYARMTGKPAATLTHLGPGFANSLANLHNARRARSPLLNIVGDHATYHIKYDTPLTSDISAYAAAAQSWWHRSESAAGLPAAAAEAIAAARAYPGRIATLIVPADHAWGAANGTAEPPAPVGPAPVPQLRLDEAAEIIRAGSAALLLGGKALSQRGLAAAGRIRDGAAARLIAETFAPRLDRGAGRVAVERLPYFADWIAATLAEVKHLILVGAAAPASFFAYEGQSSWASPPGCTVTTLAEPGEDLQAALEALAQRLGVETTTPARQAPSLPDLPSGELTAEGVAAVVARTMPPDAIVSDEAITAGIALYPATQGAAPHTWLNSTGGAIGDGMPLAVGAAVACADRKVINLQADGSALYTVQALWTQARENLNVATVIFANHSYEILKLELMKTGQAMSAGETARSLLSLGRPNVDWVHVARGFGVEAGRATTVEEFGKVFARALEHRGPYLVEAAIKPLM